MLKPHALHGLERAEGGDDAEALRRAIDAAAAVRATGAALDSARKRLAALDKARSSQQARLESLGIAALQEPDDMLCPITFDRMVDPVVASDGHTYERAAIEAVMGPTGNGKSPITREPLTPGLLLPNTNVKKRIRSYEEELLKSAEAALAHAAAKDGAGGASSSADGAAAPRAKRARRVRA